MYNVFRFCTRTTTSRYNNNRGDRLSLTQALTIFSLLGASGGLHRFAASTAAAAAAMRFGLCALRSSISRYTYATWDLLPMIMRGWKYALCIRGGGGERERKRMERDGPSPSAIEQPLSIDVAATFSMYRPSCIDTKIPVLYPLVRIGISGGREPFSQRSTAKRDFSRSTHWTLLPRGSCCLKHKREREIQRYPLFICILYCIQFVKLYSREYIKIRLLISRLFFFLSLNRSFI